MSETAFLCRQLRYPQDIARGIGPRQACIDAADTIERLEREVAALREALENARHWLGCALEYLEDEVDTETVHGNEPNLAARTVEYIRLALPPLANPPPSDVPSNPDGQGTEEGLRNLVRVLLHWPVYAERMDGTARLTTVIACLPYGWIHRAKGLGVDTLGFGEGLPDEPATEGPARGHAEIQGDEQ